MADDRLARSSLIDGKGKFWFLEMEGYLLYRLRPDIAIDGEIFTI